MVMGTLSLVQKGPTSGCSGIVVYGGGNIVFIVFGAKRSNHWTQWTQWNSGERSKTMSPPPYTTIPQHPFVWWFCTKDNVTTTIYHYSTVSTVPTASTVSTASTASTLLSHLCVILTQPDIFLRDLDKLPDKKLYVVTDWHFRFE